MVMDYLENTIQLLLILIALLISLFRYINSKKHGWLLTVGFFTSSLLSSYFWTAYLVLMGDSPNASDFLTYFGWNVSYFMLLLLTVHVKSQEERRYFHPLIFLPIPLNAWFLHLYLQFGGFLNNIYQVTVCTGIVCSCVQSLLWYGKQRRNGARFPYIITAILVYTIAEFGMWTSSCYDGFFEYLYYFFSFLCSASYLLMLWAPQRQYADLGEETAPIDQSIQDFLKISYVGLVFVCSLGGIVLGGWIRDVLVRNANVTNESEAYDIISVILFLISIVIAVVAVGIMLVVYFEEKIAENARLSEEKQVAERSNAAKSDFLANMSHEIRTPLNAVLGMNQLIVQETSRARGMQAPDNDAMQQVFSNITEYTGNIERAGNNLLSIINDILDFSKIEAGKLSITEHEYLLSAVLSDMSTMTILRAKDKSIEFVTDIDETVPDHLYGDDMRIRQVLTNILSNAVKYTDSGSITLSLRGAGKYQAGEAAELVFAVRDSGIGIRKEELAKIFDKFERTDLERNNTVEGTGLGLAITQHLVERMGGSIFVESEYGKGSVFTILLPQRVVSAEPIGDFREKLEKNAGAQHPDQRLFRAPQARILIVDDTRMNLSVAAGLLRETEICTDTAESGAAALRLCAENRYDLILLDQRMPVMDGTETLRRLRAQEHSASSGSPVICLTADALSGARERYLAEGFTDYLSKPINSHELMKLLMEYLPAEKLLPVSEPRSQTAPSAENDSLYAALREAGISVETGLGYCQKDGELYRLLLQEFVQGASEKRRDLQRYYDTQDAKNYGILVHSLKSASKTIGAAHLSELAAKLEKAADDEDRALLESGHPGLLELYDTLVRSVTEAFGNGMQPAATAGGDEILEFFPENCAP